MGKITLLFFLLATSLLQAQVQETLPPNYIKTIKFTGQNEFSGTPIVKLGASLTLSFDDLVGDEENYYYTIEYYNFDWTPTTLFKNEYLNGFDDTRILNYKNSFNSLQIYSHYRLSIPNNTTRGLKKSGNYMIRIFNNKEELVFSRKFMVYEDLASVKVQIKRSRELQYIHTKQVVNFSINGNEKITFKNPNKTVKTLLIQNNNLQNSIYDLTPQYTSGNQLIYRYDQKSAFWGGNEFLNFDSKDVRASSNNIQHIELKEIYNTYLYTDSPRKDNTYSYNPDINGNFKIRTLQGEDATIESEYTWVHFSLKSPKMKDGGELHIYGNFNNYAHDKSTAMTYDESHGTYRLKRLFKQGFYNYKYVLVKKDGKVDEGFISGNFDKTENEYTVLVYYRDIGGRYDRIVGAGSANSRAISN